MATPSPDRSIEIDPRELSGVFAVPQWLRDVGQTSWLLVGVALFLVGMVWLLSLTDVIVLPAARGRDRRRGRLAPRRLAQPRIGSRAGRARRC